MKSRWFRIPPLRTLIGGALVAAAVASSTFTRSVATQTPTPVLIDLGDSSELRAQFNRDRGVIRLVLLVSPT